MGPTAGGASSIPNYTYDVADPPPMPPDAPGVPSISPEVLLQQLAQPKRSDPEIAAARSRELARQQSQKGRNDTIRVQKAPGGGLAVPSDGSSILGS